jgi:hypothetical protein
LAAYAESKRLPVEFLADVFGLTEITYGGAPALRTPYRDENGTEIAIRFRTALTKGDGVDDRFRWKNGSKPALYGLWKLAAIRDAGEVVLVEGESCTHTLAFCGEPAIGVPGATNWREEWAKHLAGIGTIYVVIEPDRGGEAVRKWIGSSEIRDRVKLITLDGAKDVSELYLSDPSAFNERWVAAKGSARAWNEQQDEERRKIGAEAWRQCEDVARHPRILDRFVNALESCGVIGEPRVAKLVYLATTSRLLDRIVSVAVKGPSSGGKSFVSQSVLRFFPPSAYYALTSASEKALLFSAEPLAHRMLVIYEADGLGSDFGQYLIRTLLSEGCLRHETVSKTANGELQALAVEKKGPTGLIVTTTKAGLHPENETRLVSVTVNDTPEQTKRIMLATARHQAVAFPEHELAAWHSLQTWLENDERRVVIPFASELAARIPPVAVRLRRDWAALLGLIGAHALLHRASRDRDDLGRIVATLEDYAVVRELVGDLMSAGVQVSVKPEVRETVRAVVEAKETAGGFVTANRVAAILKLDKSAASRRIHEALACGYLRNEQTARFKPMQLEVGDPLPEEVVLLPKPADLLHRKRRRAERDGRDWTQTRGHLATGPDAS